MEINWKTKVVNFSFMFRGMYRTMPNIFTRDSLAKMLSAFSH